MMKLIRPERHLARFPSPLDTFDALFDRLARFDDVLPSRAAWRSALPLVEVDEREDAVVLTAELPGLGPEDVKVEIERDVLTLSHERTEESRNAGFYRRSQRFRRSFRIPAGVKAEAITAEMKNGVLSVVLPKDAPKRVTVQVAPGKAEGPAAPPAADPTG
jgi:HSP20 family protein